MSNVNGMTVHALEAGFETPGRPAVLLLHGFPELAYSWRKVMLPLAAAGYHVIAPTSAATAAPPAGTTPTTLIPILPHSNMVRDAIGLVYALGHRSVAASWARCRISGRVVVRADPARHLPVAGADELAVRRRAGLLFNTANGAPPPRPAPTDDGSTRSWRSSTAPEVYQNYQRTRGANDDMLHARKAARVLSRLLSLQECRLEREQAFPLKARTAGAGEDSDLLRDGSRQGHGGDGGG